MDNQQLNRKTIGLLFLSDYSKWSGGIIYILNIISALNKLQDHDKPQLEIFYGPSSPINDVRALEYPYIKFTALKINLSFFERVYNTLIRIITKKSRFFKILPDIIYPYEHGICLGKSPIYWIPDFQEWYLPYMFSKKDIEIRKNEQCKISESKGVVIFSSENARNDFLRFYPNHNCELRLLRFASTLPDFSHLDASVVCKKYSIEKPYFMSPNQFWKHKNHIVILEAISRLKNSEFSFQVVFTGSENDYRNKDYFQMLKNYVSENNLENWVKFLGFISREDQLCLMDNSLAIIQPSLFEGWSTVVEDAKSLSQFIILSDIEVHKEQIRDNSIFFNPKSSVDLSTIMRDILENGVNRKDIDYSSNIINFGKSILNALH